MNYNERTDVAKVTALAIVIELAMTLRSILNVDMNCEFDGTIVDSATAFASV